MSLIDKIQSGRRSAPPRIMIYGIEGIGKSNCAACAPKPVFVQTEDGLGEIDCDKFPLATSLDEISTALRELISQDHDYLTVAIDSLDWLERLIWDRVCHEFGTSSIEKADGGYGKGYVYALNHWRGLIGQLNQLRQQRGMAIILVAHSKIEKFEDPETAPYDRYSPRLHKHAAALLTEWCDAVLFATCRIRTQTEDAGFGRKRTTAHSIGGERILRTVGRPAFVAKNRYNLEPELPLDWNAIMSRISARQTNNN